MFSNIFNVFSRREEVTATSKQKKLSPEFRNRIVMLLQDELGFAYEECLVLLQRKVAYLHGRVQLTNSKGSFSQSQDLLFFLSTCNDEHFLDVIELIFKSGLPGITYPDNALIPQINNFFQIDNLPYHLTGYSFEYYEETSQNHNFRKQYC